MLRLWPHQAADLLVDELGAPARAAAGLARRVAVLQWLKVETGLAVVTKRMPGLLPTARAEPSNPVLVERLRSYPFMQLSSSGGDQHMSLSVMDVYWSAWTRLVVRCVS